MEEKKIAPFKKVVQEEKKEEREVSIQIKDLYKSYGTKEVLKGIDLQVYEGEVLGFIGKNGAGKSTTIDCMVGLKDPTSGNILINGYDIKKNPIECKMQFGYVSSEPIAYEVMTGIDYLKFVGSSYGMTQEAFDKNVDFLKVKLMLPQEDLVRRISQYSHGMKQKLCLMASLIHNPEVWILDEPTVGLDIMVYETLMDMLKEFAKHGKTVFVTSHNIDMVSRICDRVAIINHGKIEKLLDFKENPFARRDLSKIFFQICGDD